MTQLEKNQTKVTEDFREILSSWKISGINAKIMERFVKEQEDLVEMAKNGKEGDLRSFGEMMKLNGYDQGKFAQRMIKHYKLQEELQDRTLKFQKWTYKKDKRSKNEKILVDDKIIKFPASIENLSDLYAYINSEMSIEFQDQIVGLSSLVFYYNEKDKDKRIDVTSDKQFAIYLKKAPIDVDLYCAPHQQIPSIPPSSWNQNTLINFSLLPADSSISVVWFFDPKYESTRSEIIKLRKEIDAGSFEERSTYPNDTELMRIRKAFEKVRALPSVEVTVDMLLYEILNYVGFDDISSNLVTLLQYPTEFVMSNDKISSRTDVIVGNLVKQDNPCLSQINSFLIVAEDKNFSRQNDTKEEYKAEAELIGNAVGIQLSRFRPNKRRKSWPESSSKKMQKISTYEKIPSSENNNQAKEEKKEENIELQNESYNSHQDSCLLITCAGFKLTFYASTFDEDLFAAVYAGQELQTQKTYVYRLLPSYNLNNKDDFKKAINILDQYYHHIKNNIF